MFRKVIMTTILALVSRGDSSHLGGALLVTFFYLLALNLLKPYLNQGLNIFQRLCLISQFLTTFSALMLFVSNLDETADAVGTFALDVLITIANVGAAGLYPGYAFCTAYLDHHKIDLSNIFRRCLDYLFDTRVLEDLKDLKKSADDIHTLRQSVTDLRGLSLFPLFPPSVCV